MSNSSHHQVTLHQFVKLIFSCNFLKTFYSSTNMIKATFLTLAHSLPWCVPFLPRNRQGLPLDFLKQKFREGTVNTCAILLADKWSLELASLFFLLRFFRKHLQKCFVYIDLSISQQSLLMIVHDLTQFYSFFSDYRSWAAWCWKCQHFSRWK